jgi:hypothetical protein
MMKKLLRAVDMSFPYDGMEWQNFLGKCRTENGLVINGIFHRKFNKSEQTLIYVKGHLLQGYSYPLIERRFSSPMVNEYNLCFVGGWFPCDQFGQYIGTMSSVVNRVIEGLKPMSWCGAWKTYPSRVTELIYLEKQARIAGLATSMTETDNQVRLSVCRRGKLEEMFDLEALRDDYIEFRYKMCRICHDDFFVDRVIEALKKMQGKCLEHFVDWNIEPEEGINYCIKTGLFLGYPHETTFAIVKGYYFSHTNFDKYDNEF